MCRNYMLTVMKACHRVAMTPDVELEWQHRASNWSREWYASMVRKSKVRWVRPADCAEIEAAFEGERLRRADVAAMRKDLRLVAAALSASRMIVTLDTTSVQLFTELAERVRTLEVIRWIDPMSGELPPHRH